MEIEKIRDVILTQMQRLKRVNIEPVCVVVSQDVMYDIKSSLDGGNNPYYPYFTRAVIKLSTDTFAGLPIGVVEAGDEVTEFIQVGGMV